MLYELLDRKMPHSGSPHPSLFQSSQATILELWASPDLLRPPWTQLDTSLSHQETKLEGWWLDVNLASHQRGF